jgi:hypothetical protein
MKITIIVQDDKQSILSTRGRGITYHPVVFGGPHAPENAARYFVQKYNVPLENLQRQPVTPTPRVPVTPVPQTPVEKISWPVVD